MTAKIAVIGCGSIGMRHVEALGRMRRAVTIYAVDMNDAAAQKAKALFETSAAETGAFAVEIVTANAIDQLPDRLDLAIIATTAQRRLDAIEALLRHCQVDAMILEKFLFPRPEDYVKAAGLLAPLRGRVWVNCTRRVYPVYQEIARQVRGARFVNVSVSCQASVSPIGAIAIHFADLLAFLGGDGSATALNTMTQNVSLLRTRRNVDDFAGVVRMCSADGRLCMSYAALDSTDAPLGIYIDTDKGRWVIHEGCQSALAALPETSWRFEPMAFNVLYQSRLTNLIAEDILAQSDCGLPTFSESAEIHMSLLTPLLDAYRAITNNPQANAVPFT